MADKTIRVGLIGVGNCSSTLVQALHLHRNTGDVGGLLRREIGGYTLDDIEVSFAVDVDVRKVGVDLSEAIYAGPNNCQRLTDEPVPPTGLEVAMGPVLDGVPPHLAELVRLADRAPLDVVDALRSTGTNVLLNTLPTGSAAAARFYAEAAIEAGAAFINGMPETLVCDPDLARRAADRGVPLVGDDVKSQFGATIVHRALLSAMVARGVDLRRTYQLNYAGNTDFKNLVHRGASKEHTKASALTSLVPHPIDVSAGFAYMPAMGDRKTAEIYIDGANFGSTPVRIRATLEVEDSANFGGVAVDAIRCCQVAQDRGIGGVLESASALLMKHPPVALTDEEADRRFEEFVAGTRER